MQSSAPYKSIPSSRQSAADASEIPDRCPFLGTATDPAMAHEFPSDANRCYTTRLGVPVSTIHQENYCLSSRFESCPVYRERIKRAGGETIVSPAVIATIAAASPLVWHDEAHDEAAAADPAPVESVTNGVASTPVDEPVDTAAPLLFPWEMQTGAPHPDFQNDPVAKPYRRQSRGISLRPVLIGLLLLALIPLVWWLWTTVRPGASNEVSGAPGAIVTLPTVAGAGNGGEAGGDRGGTSDLPPAGGESGAIAGGAADEPTMEPTAEPTATDLEKIAATATALFANATPVTECVAPSWWVAYLVEEGDTIEALAATRGIKPEALIVANCLAGPDLEPGLTLLLPPVGVIASLPEASPTPTATATRRPQVPGLPTRRPIFLPTPTFPVIIILTPQVPVIEPTDPPDEEPPVRATRTPSVSPTATAPNPFPQATLTPPGFITSTPPGFITSTPPGFITSTPPSPGGTIPVTPTMTPPAPGR